MMYLFIFLLLYFCLSIILCQQTKYNNHQNFIIYYCDFAQHFVMKSKVDIPDKSIKILSQYNYFDIFVSKKQHESSVRIPDTILIQKGTIKEWLFNSSKLKHPILKKKKENLTPFGIVKHFCNKFGYTQIANNHNTINDIYQAIVKSQNDNDFAKLKYAIDILTQDNMTHQLNFIEFLQSIMNSNKAAQMTLYEKWKMIQQRVTTSKIQQCFEVESIKKNHIIDHKCNKMITVKNDTQSTQLISQNQNHKPLAKKKSHFQQLNNIKNIQQYKFFDSFLNKKFFQMVEQMIETIQRNFKCKIISIRTKFVINKDRQPFLKGIEELNIKPISRLCQLYEFQLAKEQGPLKLSQYNRLLFLMKQKQFQTHKDEYMVKKKVKCKGKFCNCQCIDDDLKIKLPTIKYNNPRKINAQLIKLVRKNQVFIVQKLKQFSLISQSFELNEESSSQYDTDQQGDASVLALKVCERCFCFYESVNKIYEINSDGELSQKKLNTLRHKSATKLKKPVSIEKNYTTLKNNNVKIQQTSIEQLKKQQEHKSNIDEIYKSIKHQKSTRKISFKRNVPNSEPKRLLTMNNNQLKSKIKLQPLKNQKQKVQTQRKDNEELPKQTLALGKLSLQLNLKEKPKQKKVVITKIPQNLQQALQQLLKRLSQLPSSSSSQLFYYCKKFYEDNVPQFLDRKCFSSEYLTNVYQFITNSPLNLPVNRRIKKRPEMSMKRLSDLTDYPEIVSKSTFMFDTLICNQTTTIPYCVITTKMLGIKNIKTQPYQNIIIVNDIFDSFIQHISSAKTMIQQSTNKRVILMNRPGQSHTIYNNKQLFIFPMFCDILEKLLYRLSKQMKIIDFQKDSFKFIGFGLGANIIASYLGYYHTNFNHLKGALLFNPYYRIPESYSKMLDNLHQLYSSNDPTAKKQAYLYYNKAIDSTQLSREDLERKEGLNSIKQQGRIYILQSVINERSMNIINNFQHVQCPVQIVYGFLNKIIPKHTAHQFLFYPQNDKNKQIPNRKFYEVDGGHDINADNYDQVLFRMTQFSKLE